MRLALILLAGIAACTHPEAVAGLAAPAVADSSAVPASGPAPVIVLERTGCEGTCPGYTVSATAAGHVVFEGELFVATMRAEAQVSPDTVAALVAQAAALGHSRLPESIVGPPLCPDPPTDMPSATTTVRSAAGTSRVHLYGGCHGFEDLEAFGGAIDRALGTEAWVGPREPWTGRP